MNTYKSLSAQEILNKKIEPAPAVSEPLLSKGEALMLWAESGVGKSLFTLHWMLALSSGKTFGPWKTSSPQTVCYLDMEMSASEIHGRILQCSKNTYCSKAGLNNFHVISNAFQNNQKHDDERFDLNVSSSIEQLVSTLKKIKADYIVIDNLTTASDSIVSENDAAAMKSVLKNIKGIVNEGFGLILIHHSTKANGSYRGSGSLEAIFHTVIRAESIKNDDGPCLDVVARKSRNGRFRVGDKWRWTFSNNRWSETESDDLARMSHILSTLENGSFRSQKELASALGVSAVQVSRDKNSLIDRGMITKEQWNSHFITASREGN